MAEVMSDENFVAYGRKYCDFKQKVPDVELGSTSQLWMLYTDHIWLMLSLIRAVKNSDHAIF